MSRRPSAPAPPLPGPPAPLPWWPPVDTGHGPALLDRPGWQQALLRHRAVTVLVTLGGVGVLVLARPAPRPAPAGLPVVVLTRLLGAGAVLGPADLRVTHWPAALVPAGVVASPAAAVGRVLSGAAAAGEPVTSARLSAPALPSGEVAVAVRLADPLPAGLVTPGAVVALLAGPAADGGGPARVLATRVQVLASGTDSSGAAVLTVAVPPAAALAVAAAGAARITVAVLPVAG